MRRLRPALAVCLGYLCWLRCSASSLRCSPLSLRSWSVLARLSSPLCRHRHHRTQTGAPRRLRQSSRSYLPASPPPSVCRSTKPYRRRDQAISLFPPPTDDADRLGQHQGDSTHADAMPWPEPRQKTLSGLRKCPSLVCVRSSRAVPTSATSGRSSESLRTCRSVGLSRTATASFGVSAVLTEWTGASRRTQPQDLHSESKPLGQGERQVRCGVTKGLPGAAREHDSVSRRHRHARPRWAWWRSGRQGAANIRVAPSVTVRGATGCPAARAQHAECCPWLLACCRCMSS